MVLRQTVFQLQQNGKIQAFSLENEVQEHRQIGYFKSLASLVDLKTQKVTLQRTTVVKLRTQ